MSRLLVLLLLAFAPLVASAHGGHHAPPDEAPAADAGEVNGSIAASVAAPSRCPGGGHEDCCCHDGWCTTGSAAIAIAGAPAREVPSLVTERSVPSPSDPALPSAALLRFSPRGPPLLS